MKQTTSFRLSAECRDLLAQLAKRDGISRASVIELMVRDRARATFGDSRKPVSPSTKPHST